VKRESIKILGYVFFGKREKKGKSVEA